MINQEKLDFLLNDYFSQLKKIDSGAKPLWGKMTPQHMIEHMSDSVRIANGKVPHSLKTAAENLERVRNFMLSDKPFRENTRNSLMPDDLPPSRLSLLSEALEELRFELNDFKKVFEQQPGKEIMNPFFGSLNFEQWTHLLHKHALHHLKQFGINI